MTVRVPAEASGPGAAARTLRIAVLVALAGYVAALLLGPREHLLWREWLGQGLVLVLAAGHALVLTASSRRDRPRRAVITLWLALFAAGNLVQNAHHGQAAPDWQNLVSLVLFLGCYPLAITAVLLSHRGRWVLRSVGTLLDALVPALTIAAVFVAAILPPALEVLADHGTGALYVVVMPALDVTAAILLVVMLAFTGGRPQRVTGGLFLGMALFGSADSRWAIAMAEGVWRTGTPLDAIWVIGCVVLSLGATTAPGRVHDRVMGVAALAVPLLGALTSLVLVLVGTQVPLSPVALGLAAAAILGALLRLVHAYAQVLTLEETRRQARTDPLTGLGNRRGLQEAVDELARALPFRPFAVVLADLDRFKAVNDDHGHGVGDALLQVVAARLRGALPPEAVLTRLGGDEFALVLPLARHDRAEADLVTAVRAAGEAATTEWLRDGVRFAVGASFGVAVSRRPGEDLADLLHRADVAMYRAKRAAGGEVRVHVHRPGDGPGHGARPDRLTGRPSSAPVA